MKKILIGSLALAIATTSVAPAFAQNIIYDINSISATRNSVHAGFYIKKSFDGGLKTQGEDRFQYGAQFGVRQNYTLNTNGYALSKAYEMNFAKLNFNQTGFKTLQLSGKDILLNKNGQLVFAADEGDKTDWGDVGLTTLAVIGGILALGGLAFFIADHHS